jgi:mannose/fructose/N-acetylgalactosamine-specific phosphotransferase system component IIC
MLYAALVCVFVYWVTNVISKIFLVNVAWSPLVICPLMGLFFGQVQTGIVMGGYLQAIFLGVIGIGGEKPADKQIGSIVPCAFVMVGGLDMETGLAIAYTIGVLSNSLNRLTRTIFAAIEPYWKKLAEQADRKKYNSFYIFYWLVLSLLPGVLIIFFSVFLGTEAVSAAINLLPAKLLTGLNASTTMMTAVGIAIAMRGVWSTKFAGFFFIGWVMSKIIGMSAVSCAIVAFSIAVVWFFMSGEKAKNIATAGDSQKGGDFF